MHARQEGLPDEERAKRGDQPGDEGDRGDMIALAANTMPRRGMMDSEVRIMPVEYSEVMVSAPSTA